MSHSQSLQASMNQGSMNQHLRLDPVPFIDVAAQRRRLGSAIDDALAS